MNDLTPLIMILHDNWDEFVKWCGGDESHAEAILQTLCKKAGIDCA